MFRQFLVVALANVGWTLNWILNHPGFRLEFTSYRNSNMRKYILVVNGPQKGLYIKQPRFIIVPPHEVPGNDDR